ncbi:DUF1127 domain-containing protein [Breoghania sp.]|uniref:DUF1127 domain-containing protein n=1 Tax=Breoghania sp. TaxID=2065378 RepID=UPI0029C9D75C|nr:DUF1127 domain-containing protein [Breoghania sp.]
MTLIFNQQSNQACNGTGRSGSFGAAVGRAALFALRGGAFLIGRIIQAYASRRELNRLLANDDRMLRDIGITRTDIHAALGTSATQDPSLVLANLAYERRDADLLTRQERRERRERSRRDMT